MWVGVFNEERGMETRLLSKKTPPKTGETDLGGKLIAYSLEEKYYIIAGYAIKCWTPTGIIPSYGVHRLLIPRTVVRWRAHVSGGHVVKGGFLVKIFTGIRAVIVLDNSGEKYSLLILGSNKTGSPEYSAKLTPQVAYSLPVGENCEGILLNISVDTAPAAIELKFTASEKIASGKLHIRINLINSSGNVVCTTPATILEGKYFKAVLLAPKKGDYMIQVNLQYLSQDKVSLTMTLSKVEKTSLSSFNYNKEWNVWVGILKSIKQ